MKRSLRTGAPKWPSVALVLSTGLSGAALWVAQAQGEGATPSPWLGLCLKLHGFAAALGLVLLGWVLADHVPGAWLKHQRRRSGPLLLGLLVALSLSGWALYYTADEGWRVWIAGLHRWTGALLPLVGLAHGLKRKEKSGY